MKKETLEATLTDEERLAFDVILNDTLEALASMKGRLQVAFCPTASERTCPRGLIRALVRLNYAESRLWTRPDTVPADAIPALEDLATFEPQTPDETLAWATELRREVNALFVMLEGIP